MPKPPIELGAVYQTDFSEHPIRVIAFDESTAMYDVWWPHAESWGLMNWRRATTYYRVPVELLATRAHFVRVEAYTESEFKLHRPDLPFALGRFEQINWTASPPADIAVLQSHLRSAATFGGASDRPACLGAAAIYLEPFGPKGGPRPGSLIEARNGRAFSEEEVLWHAWRLQAPLLRGGSITSGIGIHRSGIKGRLPSFYIWGSKSRLEDAVS